MKWKDIIEIIVILLIIVLIRTFLFTPAKVNGESMDDTLANNEIIIVNKINYSINEAKRFDIIVFKLDNNEKLIKRVIGLPGDKVEYKDNVLYINDEKIETPIEFEETNDFVYEKVGEGKYFVLGDNRNASIDSRIFGAIDKKQVIGTVKLVLFPFNKFGFVK